MRYLCIHGAVVDDLVTIVHRHVHTTRDRYGGAGVEVCSVFPVFRRIETTTLKLMDGKIHYIHVYILQKIIEITVPKSLSAFLIIFLEQMIETF